MFDRMYFVLITCSLILLACSNPKGDVSLPIYTVSEWQSKCINQAKYPSDLKENPSMFCKALSKTKLADQIDADNQVDESRLGMVGARYMFLIPSNKAIQAYLQKNNLSEEAWLSGWDVETFVKRHIAQAPGFWESTAARTYPYSVVQKTMAGTELSVMVATAEDSLTFNNQLAKIDGSISFFIGIGAGIDQTL